MNPSIEIKNPKELVDKESIIKHIKTSKMVSHLQYLSEEIRSDKEVFIEATKVYYASIGFASDKLANDINFARELFKIDSRSFLGLHKDLVDNIGLLLEALSYSKNKSDDLASFIDISKDEIKEAIKSASSIQDYLDILEKCDKLQKAGFKITMAPFEKQYQAYTLSKDLDDNVSTKKAFKI